MAANYEQLTGKNQWQRQQRCLKTISAKKQTDTAHTGNIAVVKCPSVLADTNANNRFPIGNIGAGEVESKKTSKNFPRAFPLNYSAVGY
jgi:hypothetical protein